MYADEYGGYGNGISGSSSGGGGGASAGGNFRNGSAGRFGNDRGKLFSTLFS